MHFRVGSRIPVTFKTKLYVLTVNNSFQSLHIFCHKEFYLRCYMMLELNIVTLSTKILEGIGWHWTKSSTNLGKIWKTHSPRCPKKHFQRFFGITFYAFNTKWTKGAPPFDFIKCNLIWKSAYKIKYIIQINGGLMFFGNWGIWFIQIFFLSCGEKSCDNKEYSPENSKSCHELWPVSWTLEYVKQWYLKIMILVPRLLKHVCC